MGVSADGHDLQNKIYALICVDLLVFKSCDARRRQVLDVFRPQTDHCHHLYHRRRLAVIFFAGLRFGDCVLCGLAIARMLTSARQIVPYLKACLLVKFFLA